MDDQVGSAPVSRSREGREAMKRRFSGRRAVGLVLAGGLVLVLAGDRGRASVTATPGIDPLEVLGLQIKPNVILVLDTSGSMNDSVGNNTLGGDHPDSKIGAAKRVLLQAIQNNESKVNFMFGTYTQSTSATPVQTPSTLGNTGLGQDRFSYWAKSSDFPSMLTSELFLSQVYAVTYAAGKFTFSQTGLKKFRLRWSQATNSIGAVLSAGATDTALDLGPFATSGDARIKALRKILGDRKFTESGTTFYEMVAGRFWNGQTLYVLNSTGTVCGQAATVTPTNPPTVSLQQVSDCTNPTTTTVGVPVAFTSAGGKARLLGGGGFGTNAVSCDGFLPRVQLVACDIKIPPNPQQSDNIGTPFLEPTLRIETTPGPTFGQPIGYTETTDGTGCTETSCANGVTIPTVSAYGLPADGSTPIANTLRD